jgi:segregation and condensation protein B
VELQQLQAAIEAVVFASDEPVTRHILKSTLGEEVAGDDLTSALTGLAEAYRDPGRGVELVEVAGGFTFRTKPSQADVVARLSTQKPVRLSRAASETLAIVAYRQPVTRGGVEDIRGVDSGATLKTLLERKLVRILGRSDAVGNPILYGTTRDFLETFGLKDLSSLPTLQEFQELDEESRAILGDDPDAEAQAGQEDLEAAEGQSEEAVSEVEEAGQEDLEAAEGQSEEAVSEVEEAGQEDLEAAEGQSEEAVSEVEEAGQEALEAAEDHAHPPAPEFEALEAAADEAETGLEAGWEAQSEEGWETPGDALDSGSPSAESVQDHESSDTEEEDS